MVSAFHSEEARSRRRGAIDRLRRWDPLEVDWTDVIGAELRPSKLPAGPRVAFVGSDYGGAGRLRSFWPAIALAESGVNVTHASIEFPRRGTFDVLWVHRMIHDEQLAALERVVTDDVVVIHDEDDAIDRLPPGFDYGRYDNDAHGYLRFLANHREVLRRADLLTVSTAFLADHYRDRAARIRLAPNYLPAWIAGCRLERAPGDLVRVGWAGIVGTHAHDLEWLARYSRSMLRGAMFTTVGNGELTAQRLRIPRGFEREVFPVEFGARRFYELMGRADVGLVPLLPGLDLNRGKSYLKALEYHLLGIPVVATRYPEQEALIVDGVTGFLADSPAEFAEHVQRLVWDPGLRARMGEAARARGFAFTIERNVDAWRSVLVEVGAADMLTGNVTRPGPGPGPGGGPHGEP